jgi:hypothetical protein
MRIPQFRKMFGPASLGLAVLFALSASVAAQDKGAKAPEKPSAAPATPATPASPSAAPRVQSGDSTSVAVTGLTKDNSAATKTALEGLSHTVWRCPACNLTEAAKGTCAMCKEELVSEKSATLQNVKLDADKGTIAFALAPGQTVRLTEIEAVLTPEKISIPKDKLTLSPSSTLVVSGVSTEEAIKKLETELKNAKMFDSVACRLTGSGKPAEVTVKNGNTSLTRAKVEEAISKASPEFKLVDIVWTSPVAAASPPAGKPKG